MSVAGVIGATTAVVATVGVGPASAATPIAVWHMEETSGTTMDDAASAGGDNDGALHNVALGLSGKSGQAYGFDGKSSYVSVRSTDSLNAKSADISISVSFTTTSLPSSADWDLVRKGYFATSGGEWKVELQPSGRASCAFKGSTKYVYLEAGPDNLDDGSWHTLTCTKRSSAVTLVIDGRSFVKSGAVGSIANAKPVVIGAYPGKEFFKGTLDEVSISIG